MQKIQNWIYWRPWVQGLISHFKVLFSLHFVTWKSRFSLQWFRNKTAFLFETSQPRISLFECWDESSSDHRDVPDALPLLPCPQDPGQPDYLLLYHSCVFSNFTQTREVWNKLLNLRGILGYANQKKICIFSLYDYYVKWKERLAVSAVSAKETIVFHLL